MKAPSKIGLGLAGTALLLSGLARVTPYLPGDLPLARVVQSILPVGAWADWLSMGASAPWKYVALAAAIALAWWGIGRRAAIVILAATLLIPPAGEAVKPFFGRPRPSPGLVRVAGRPSGFSYPSGTAISYGTTFGAVGLLALFGSRRRLLLVTIACAVLVPAGAARVVLGAHWPSDILGGYAMALFGVLVLDRGLAATLGV
jgi:undecaprenyl-diphosphatase